MIGRQGIVNARTNIETSRRSKQRLIDGDWIERRIKIGIVQQRVVVGGATLSVQEKAALF
jgi:hypothetical protein